VSIGDTVKDVTGNEMLVIIGSEFLRKHRIDELRDIIPEEHVVVLRELVESLRGSLSRDVLLLARLDREKADIIEAEIIPDKTVEGAVVVEDDKLKYVGKFEMVDENSVRSGDVTIRAEPEIRPRYEVVNPMEEVEAPVPEVEVETVTAPRDEITGEAREVHGSIAENVSAPAPMEEIVSPEEIDRIASAGAEIENEVVGSLLPVIMQRNSVVLPLSAEWYKLLAEMALATARETGPEAGFDTYREVFEKVVEQYRDRIMALVKKEAEDVKVLINGKEVMLSEYLDEEALDRVWSPEVEDMLAMTSYLVLDRIRSGEPARMYGSYKYGIRIHGVIAASLLMQSSLNVNQEGLRRFLENLYGKTGREVQEAVPVQRVQEEHLEPVQQVIPEEQVPGEDVQEKEPEKEEVNV